MSATKTVNLKIDVSPEGIRFTIEGMEDDLAQLIQEAQNFEVVGLEYRSVDTSDVTIRSVKSLTFVDRVVETPDTEEVPPTEGTETP